MDNNNKETTEQPKTIKTDWKNPPTLVDLKANLTDATPDQQSHVEDVNGWLDNFHVKGKAEAPKIKGKSSIVPKLIRKHAEWRYPALSEPFLSTQDMFKVAPVTAEDKKAAIQNQILLNNQFNTKINKVQFIDEYVRTAVEEGTIVAKVGWVFKEEQVEEEEPTYELVEDPEFDQVIQQLQQMQVEDPSLYQTDVPDHIKVAYEQSISLGIPLAPKITGKRKITKTKVVANHPTVEICNYKHVYLDPTAQGNIEKAGFIIHEYETCLSELKADGRYVNLDSIRLSDVSVLSMPDSVVDAKSSNFNFKDDPRKKFLVQEYWGYWDINDDGIVKPIVATWVGDVLIRMEENPYPDKKLPFVVVKYLPIRNSNYGEPDGSLLEDNQKIIGAVTRGMIDLMAKSANGQVGFKKNFLDVVNKRKYENGQDYEFNPTSHPTESVFVHSYSEIPQAAQFMLMHQQAEAESLTGTKAFNSGVTSESLGEVAAGIRGALDAASKRETGILRRLSAGIIEIGRKFISMNAILLSEEEVIRMTNDEFVSVRRDDLDGEFDLRLTITTAEEDNAKAQELSFMLQTMGNTMDMSMSQILLADIARLRKMPDLAKKIEQFQPQPDPVAEQLKQIELQKAQLELESIQAKTRRDMAQAALDEARINTEMAKANVLNADTDLKNLDFIEQESGVKQKRDLQLHGEQARSQAQLKALDSEEKQKDREYDLVKNLIKNTNEVI